MRKVKISRKGDIAESHKGSALCVGAHGAGNNSQCDCIFNLYEENRLVGVAYSKPIKIMGG